MEHSTSIKKTHYSQKVADELTHFLADTYALYLKTQNFHWNVKGPHFYSLHKLFEEQYQDLANAVDEIAERIRALGSYTPASFSQFSQLMSIKEERNEIDAERMVEILIKDHELLSQHATDIIPKAQKAHDEGTADIVIQRSKVHDKAVWMLKSILES